VILRFNPYNTISAIWLPIQMPKIFFLISQKPLSSLESSLKFKNLYLKTTWHIALYLIIPEWFPYWLLFPSPRFTSTDSTLTRWSSHAVIQPGRGRFSWWIALVEELKLISRQNTNTHIYAYIKDAPTHVYIGGPFVLKFMVRLRGARNALVKSVLTGPY